MDIKWGAKTKGIVTTLAITIITFASLTGAANAALMLHINTDDKTFYLTGSDDVEGSAFGLVSWGFTHGSDLTSTVLTAPTSVASLSAGSYDGGAGAPYLNFTNFNTKWSLVFDTTNNTSSFTITGTGEANAASYAGLGASIVPFEASIGVTGTGNSGEFLDPLLIVDASSSSATPEPSTALLVALGALGLFTSRRRRFN